MINWLIDGQTDRLTDWLSDRLTITDCQWLRNWLTDWINAWLTDWLTDRPTDWLNDWLTHWPTDRVHVWVSLLHILADHPIDWLLTKERMNWANNLLVLYFLWLFAFFDEWYIALIITNLLSPSASGIIKEPPKPNESKARCNLSCKNNEHD